MNQHPKRGGQANGNSVDKVQRGATRPAAVVAIAVCIGFAVAMAAIWQFRKPGPGQEMQIQPESEVQTEVPKPEPVETETSEPEPVSRVWKPDHAVAFEATPVPQASPAASQVTGNQVSSPTPAQDDQSYTFSHDLNAETTTFEGINPTTKVKGLITVTITGTFRGKGLADGESGDGESPVGSHLQGDEQATFSFVSYDRYAPSYSAIVKHLGVAGDTTNNSILLDFGLTATGSDGSSQRFELREVVTVTEDGAQVAFGQRP